MPFVTHITSHASEFSWFADIVLPGTHHMFEKWAYLKSIGNGYRQVPLMQPIIDMPFDYKSDETEIPWLIGKKLAERGFDNLNRYHRENFKDPESGKEPTNEKEFELYAVKYATQNLWDPAKHKGGDKINGWEQFRKVGVWNSDPYPYRKRWGGHFGKTKVDKKTGKEKTSGTVTHKFEFYSETLKKALKKHAKKHNTNVDGVMEVTKYQARGEKAFVPHYEEPYIHGDTSEFPLVFVDH